MTIDTTNWLAPDWSQPLEAVNTETGETWAVSLLSGIQNPDPAGDYITNEVLGLDYNVWLSDGRVWVNPDRPWRIRNCAPESETVAVEKAVWERIGQFIGRVAANDSISLGYMLHDEARELHKLLSPVDPDLIEAREICALAADEFEGRPTAGAEEYRKGGMDDTPPMKRAIAAFKASRSAAGTSC